jgi:hypothetical protein
MPAPFKKASCFFFLSFCVFVFTEAAQTTKDEGSPPPATHSITRALRFDTADSPNALIVRTPVVASRRLKSVVVVPSPEEGAKSMTGSEVSDQGPLRNSALSLICSIELKIRQRVDSWARNSKSHMFHWQPALI